MDTGTDLSPACNLLRSLCGLRPLGIKADPGHAGVHLDMAVNPDTAECAGMAALRPAMSLYTTVTMVKELEEGVAVSYGCRKAPGASRSVQSPPQPVRPATVGRKSRSEDSSRRFWIHSSFWRRGEFILRSGTAATARERLPIRRCIWTWCGSGGCSMG